jgi:membrane protein
MSVMHKADVAQQRVKPLSVPVATFKKFSEDNTTSLAAMVAFWAFFSIFPLFMVMVTILGWVLPASDKTKVLQHIHTMLPVISPSGKALSGSVVALVIGLATSLWSGIGVVRSAQQAFNSVWEIPMHERPKLKEQLLRSLGILGTLGVGIVLTTLISGLVTSSSSGINLGVAGRIAGLVISIAFDIGLFVAAFRMLTDRDVSVRDVLPGAIFSGLVFFVLQQCSALIINHKLKGASGTYGNFGFVIVILWWFYLQAVVTLLGAQLNVVLKERLFPRSITQPPSTEADHRALEAYAQERTYHPAEQVETRIETAEEGSLSQPPRRG